MQRRKQIFVKNLQMIFTQDEINLLSIKEQSGMETQIIADAHNMKCYQAKRFINNIINAVRTAASHHQQIQSRNCHQGHSFR